jgi:hypothetical protein
MGCFDHGFDFFWGPTSAHGALFGATCKEKAVFI